MVNNKACNTFTQNEINAIRNLGYLSASKKHKLDKKAAQECHSNFTKVFEGKRKLSKKGSKNYSTEESTDFSSILNSETQQTHQTHQTQQSRMAAFLGSAPTGNFNMNTMTPTMQNMQMQGMPMQGMPMQGMQMPMQMPMQNMQMQGMMQGMMPGMMTPFGSADDMQIQMAMPQEGQIQMTAAEAARDPLMVNIPVPNDPLNIPANLASAPMTEAQLPPMQFNGMAMQNQMMNLRNLAMI